MLEKIASISMLGMDCMSVTAEWIVQLVIGPQWVEAGRIFALLGIGGLLQPVANSTGWLFTTQGRTHHMFKWGLTGSSIIIAGIIVGLPWGAIGVATSYSITILFIATPLLFWFVGRQGPVIMIDFYHA